MRTPTKAHAHGGKRLHPPQKSDAYIEQFMRRFWGNVGLRDPSICWPWPMGKARGDYGCVKYGGEAGRNYFTHRVAFCLAHGIRLDGVDGSQVCHTCDNPPCCNPDHLFLGDALLNVRDAFSKGRVPRACGEANHNARLTSALVIEFRRRRQEGETMLSIAKSFALPYGTVRSACRGENWKHVSMEKR